MLDMNKCTFLISLNNNVLGASKLLLYKNYSNLIFFYFVFLRHPKTYFSLSVITYIYNRYI